MSLDAAVEIARTAPAAPPARPLDGAAHRWGWVMLGLSALCIGVAVNFTHEATLHIPVLWVVAVLCIVGPIGAVAIGWTLRLAGVRGGLATVTPASLARQLRRRFGPLSVASVLGAMAAATMVYVVHRNGAATAAFLNNLSILMLVLGGVLAGERLSRSAIAAVAAMIAGAFVYCLTRDVRVAGPALAIMTVSCMGSAIKQCIVARCAPSAELPAFVSAKQLCMAVLLGAVAWSADGMHLRADRWLACAAAAGILQSVLGMLLMYIGFQSVGIARGAPTTALRPIVVMLIGLAFGAALPGAVQMLGALLIVGGSVVLCARHRSPNTGPSPFSADDAGSEEALAIQEQTS